MSDCKESFESTKADELVGMIGQHFIYTYDNNWQYEVYVKNAKTIDYRIHTGMVGGRWMEDQPAHIIKLADGIFKFSWDEPTGTCVSVTVNFPARRLHGIIFFPKWIADDPKKTICHQNEHMDLMFKYRDEGPTYPRLLIDEGATITYLEQLGPDDHTVISQNPSDLPAGYAARKN